MRNSKKKAITIKTAVSLILMIIFIQAMSIIAFADDGDAWSVVSGFISTWIPRLGGAIIIIGLIMFGMGWQRDDPDGRTRGIQVTIGGAIVAAVAGLVEIFMA